MTAIERTTGVLGWGEVGAVQLDVLYPESVLEELSCKRPKRASSDHQLTGVLLGAGRYLSLIHISEPTRPY